MTATKDTRLIHGISLEDLVIKPISITYPLTEGFLYFVKSIENNVFSLLEKYYIDMFNWEDKLSQILPIIENTPIQKNKNTFSITILCQGENTDGITHFIPNLICHWLIFGRTLNLSSNRSLSFRFNSSSLSFTFLELTINIENIQDIHIVEENLQSLIKEIRLSILAVYHARSNLSMQELSVDEKNQFLENDLSFYLNQSSYDKTKELIYSLQKEKKLSQIRKNIAFLLTKRPLSFDRDIFDHIYHVTQLYRGHFTTERDPRHISRIIALQYFFQKILKNQLSKKKILLKVLKNHKQDKTILGIIISFHFNSEIQRFEKTHALKAISTCVEDKDVIPNSFILDKREEKLRSVYFEIQKKHISKEKIMDLRNKLPKAIFAHIEPIVHNVFKPPNEEETIRSIILLSKQLQYIKDLPQVIINYDSQNSQYIRFQIIMVRLLKPDTPPIKQLLESSRCTCLFYLEEVKTIGLLKNKYIKEANIFYISLNKSSFFRPDNSLDLRKARTFVAFELNQILGEFRDFNGGMITKQHHLFRQAKKTLTSLIKTQEHLLENVFYSLKPTIMQSILPVSVISCLFQMILSILDLDFSKQHYIQQTNIKENYQIILVASSYASIKDKISMAVQTMKIPSIDLASLFIDFEDISLAALINHIRDKKQQDKMQNIISENLNKEFSL